MFASLRYKSLIPPLPTVAPPTNANLLNSLYSGVADNMILQIALFFLKLLPVLISLFASMGLLGLFIGYVKKSNKLLDLIAKEAIGIYVIHYTVVSVYQYIFTGVDISGLIKGILVIFLSLVTSIFCVYLLNKVPYVNVVFGAKNHCKNGLFLMIITSIMLIVLMIP